MKITVHYFHMIVYRLVINYRNHYYVLDLKINTKKCRLDKMNRYKSHNKPHQQILPDLTIDNERCQFQFDLRH